MKKNRLIAYLLLPSLLCAPLFSEQSDQAQRRHFAEVSAKKNRSTLISQGSKYLLVLTSVVLASVAAAFSQTHTRKIKTLDTSSGTQNPS